METAISILLQRRCAREMTPIKFYFALNPISDTGSRLTLAPFITFLSLLLHGGLVQGGFHFAVIARPSVAFASPFISLSKCLPSLHSNWPEMHARSFFFFPPSQDYFFALCGMLLLFLSNPRKLYFIAFGNVFFLCFTFIRNRRERDVSFFGTGK
jgi:hypothetical protein